VQSGEGDCVAGYVVGGCGAEGGGEAPQGLASSLLSSKPRDVG
jgi:hypothetical protein